MNIIPEDFYKLDPSKFSESDKFEAYETVTNGNCFYDSIYKATNGEKGVPCLLISSNYGDLIATLIFNSMLSASYKR